MKDYTHLISQAVTSKMHQKRLYTETEYEVISYGLELALNTALKMISYLLLGKVTGCGKKVIAAIIVFAILRYFSGGWHAKTDTGCFICTGAIIYIAVIFSGFIVISEWIYLGLSLFAVFIYYRFSPQDEYYDRPEKNKEKQMRKLQCILLTSCFLVAGWKIGSWWKVLIFIVIWEQGFTLVYQAICDRR